MTEYRALSDKDEISVGDVLVWSLFDVTSGPGEVFPVTVASVWQNGTISVDGLPQENYATRLPHWGKRNSARFTRRGVPRIDSAVRAGRLYMPLSVARGNASTQCEALLRVFYDRYPKEFCAVSEDLFGDSEAILRLIRPTTNGGTS